jgi:hypothetical protein
MRVLGLFVCALMLPATGVFAQNQATTEVTISATRGVSAERPYTLFFPAPMHLVEDGDDVTIATLQYPNAPLQCDAMIADGGPADWAADIAAETLDRAGTEASWTEQFPGFAISEVSTIEMQSGPALYFRGASTGSPMGIAATVFHAEAVDAGRTYIYECVADTAVAEQVKGLVTFLFSNFSTRSDGECCVDPAAPKE